MTDELLGDERLFVSIRRLAKAAELLERYLAEGDSVMVVCAATDLDVGSEFLLAHLMKKVSEEPSLAAAKDVLRRYLEDLEAALPGSTELSMP